MEKNTGFANGRQNAASSLGVCMAACDNSYGCIGFDWIPVVPPGKRCLFTGSWSGQKKAGNNDGVTHYNLHRHCTGKFLLSIV